jgi:hypothetical protein
MGSSTYIDPAANIDRRSLFEELPAAHRRLMPSSTTLRIDVTRKAWRCSKSDVRSFPLRPSLRSTIGREPNVGFGVRSNSQQERWWTMDRQELDELPFFRDDEQATQGLPV